MSETTTLTISEFLKARYDEAEQIAHSIPERSWFSQLETGDDAEDFGSIYTGGPSWDDAKTVGDWYMPNVGDHIALHDPQFVLEDIMSKRAIVDHVEDWLSGIPDAGTYEAAETVLRLLAAPYRRHEAFREEWA